MRNQERLSQYMISERFSRINRTYDATHVYKLQPEIIPSYPSKFLSEKLWTILNENKRSKKASVTFGILDPVQAVSIHNDLDTVYISGWQCASSASTSQDVGPDLADYPYDTVPTKARQLYKAMEFHSAKDNSNNEIDPYKIKPMIADADTGHGGSSTVMKLTKLFIENGVAGIHLEDQKVGGKKCGHMGGKILCSVHEHIERLKSARLQCDILETPLVIVCRTDALSASFVESDCSIVDHPYLLGKCIINDELRTLTLPEAYSMIVGEECKLTGSIDEMLEKIQSEFVAFNWDYKSLRTKEGYYPIRGCIDLAINRLKHYLPYADMFWVETSAPKLHDAEYVSCEIAKVDENAFLSYNLSPSFDWYQNNMNDDDLENFTLNLMKLGYVWQFITLAGFHINGMSIELFVKKFKEQGMLAYVKNVQTIEKEHNMKILKHQAWSGARYIDSVQGLLGKDNTFAILSENATENRF